jgi:hypothetical protein
MVEDLEKRLIDAKMKVADLQMKNENFERDVFLLNQQMKKK